MPKAKKICPIDKAIIGGLTTVKQCEDLIWFIEKRKESLMKVDTNKIMKQYKELEDILVERGALQRLEEDQ